jgi:hypothetical protein
MAVQACGQNGMILPDGTIANQYKATENSGVEEIVLSDKTWHAPTGATLSANSVAENSGNGTVSAKSS